MPPIAPARPLYPIIETATDEVLPPPSAFVFESGVTDEHIQSFCPNDSAEHLEVNYDLVAVRLLLNALDPAQAQPSDCALAFPIPASLSGRASGTECQTIIGSERALVATARGCNWRRRP